MEGVLINDLLPLKKVQYFAQLLYSDKKIYIYWEKKVTLKFIV